MNPILRKYNVKPGDAIVRPKSAFEIVEHYGILLGRTHDGRELIAENHCNDGVRVITADEFFKEVPKISRIKPFTGDNVARKRVVHNALAKVGQPYSLINYNCEHFANHIQTGRPSSQQVAWGIGLSILAFIVYNADWIHATSSHPTKPYLLP